MPSVSLRSRLKLTPLTALTTPAYVKKCVLRFGDLEQAFGHRYSFSLGSVASRRPLPKAMKPKTVSTRATLGKSSIHQEPAGT